MEEEFTRRDTRPLRSVPSPHGRALPTTLAISAIAAVYLAILLPTLMAAEFNPLVFARMTRKHAAQRFWDQHPVVVQEGFIAPDGQGHDGQLFYYLARDPLLLDGPPEFLGELGYRYQRILLPAFAYVLALGFPAAIGWTLPVVNLLGLAAGCWAAACLLDHFQISRFWLLAYALNPGFVLGLPLDLSEPLALGIATLACLAYATGRHRPAVLALVAGVLAQETLLVPALGFAAYELLRARQPRRALGYLLPLLVMAAWQAIVLWRAGSLAIASGAGHLTFPFAGVAARLTHTGDRLAMGDPYHLGSAFVVAALALLAVLAPGAFRHDSAFGWQLALQGLLLLMLNERVWNEELVTVSRSAMLLFLFYLLVAFERHAGRRGDTAGATPYPAIVVSGYMGT